jgi:hypothetical protein
MIPAFMGRSFCAADWARQAGNLAPFPLDRFAILVTRVHFYQL